MSSRSCPRHVAVAPAVPLSAPSRQTFTYRLRAGSAAGPGSAVIIPFGKRRLLGVITSIGTVPPKIVPKTAVPVPGLSLTAIQMQFAHWIAQAMHGSLGYTLRLFLPPRVRHQLPPAQFPAKQKKGRKSDVPDLSHPLTIALDANTARRYARLKEYILKIISAQAGQVLILVPEKSFLPQWSDFPQLHAGLPPKVLSALWHGAAQGSLKVVVGTQKALFLPFKDLRLIVIDEEQLPTHKLWDQYPRLDSRDAARKLASLYRATLLLSASFPSLTLYQALRQPTPSLLNAPSELPVSVFPFTSSDRDRENILPLDFMETLKSWVKKKHETLLLLNRTGKEMDSLRHTLHNTFGTATRHLTLATTVIFSADPPSSFTRVAWLFPEYTFTYPDFRSVERGLVTLARLKQLLPPQQPVALVTRNLLLGHELQSLDWRQRYELLLAERKSLFLPPFTDAILLTLSDASARRARQRASKVRDTLAQRLSETNPPGVHLQGPFQSLSQEVTPTTEYHLLLLGRQEQLTPLYSDLPIDRAELSPHRIL